MSGVRRWYIMTLGEYVRNTRKDLALTQVEFASKVKITPVRLSQIENGSSPGPKVLRALAKYFKTDTATLRAMVLENDKQV